MTDTPIKCPKCGTTIQLTEALAAPLIDATNKKHAEELRTSVLEAETKVKDAALLQAQTIVERQMNTAIADAKHAQDDAAKACRDLEEMSRKLTEAQNAQAAAVRKERELADRERELNLTIERQVSAQIASVRIKAQTEAGESVRLKLMERELEKQELVNKIAELQRKADESGSRVHGEVQEVDLENMLKITFPFDTVAEIGKGVNGADVRQEVVSHTGQPCGTILWESKRTKNWSPGWLPKLRTDLREATASIAVLMSLAVPESIKGFGLIDGVWVCTPDYSIALATALRMILLKEHAAVQKQLGAVSSATQVYDYVMGVAFRHRMEAIVEAFNTMGADLEAEKRATLRQWAKRQAQIERIVENTAGMFGDLQGVSSAALKNIDGLALSGGVE